MLIRSVSTDRIQSNFLTILLFSFFNCWFLRTTFEHLKFSVCRKLIFLSNWRFRFRSYKLVQNIAVFKFFLDCILLSLMFDISPEHTWLNKDGNINYRLIANIKIFKCFPKKPEKKEGKWQRRQNLDLNPTYSQALTGTFGWVQNQFNFDSDFDIFVKLIQFPFGNF